MEESREKFSEFVSLCRSVTDGDYEVIKLVQRRFNKCSPGYIASDAFRSKLQCTMQRMHEDLTNKYVHIKDFVTTLKAREDEKECKTKKRHLDLSESSDVDSLPDIKRPRVQVYEDQASPENTYKGTKKQIETSPKEKSTNQTNSASHGINSCSNSPEPGRKMKNLQAIVTSLHHRKTNTRVTGAGFGESCSGVSGESEVEIQVGGSSEDLKQATESEEERTTTPAFEASETEESRSSTHKESGDSSTSVRGSERQIRKLEALLQEIRNEIESLEEKELTLDDLEDEESNYILIEKYKKKFVQVWNKLCAIKGRESTTGRIVERRFRFNGSRYPEINRKVEKFVNKFREFPDYQDIRDIVIRSNNKFKLKFSKKKVDFLATDIFTDVGNKLQQRRQEDFTANFGSSVTDHARICEDPALFDRNLRAKLDKNKDIGRNRLEKVIRKFAEKQEDGESSEESDEENDQSSSEQEEEEEKVKVVRTCQTPDKKITLHSSVTTKPQKYREDMAAVVATTATISPQSNPSTNAMSTLTDDEGVGIELTKYLLTDKVKQISKDVLHKILNEDKSSLKSPYKNKQRKLVHSPSTLSSSDQEEFHGKGATRKKSIMKECTKSPNVKLVDCIKSPFRNSPVKIVDLVTPVKVPPRNTESPKSPLVKLKKLDIEHSPVKISSLSEDVVGKSEQSMKSPRRITLKRIPSSAKVQATTKRGHTDMALEGSESETESKKRMSKDTTPRSLGIDLDSGLLHGQEIVKVTEKNILKSNKVDNEHPSDKYNCDQGTGESLNERSVIEVLDSTVEHAQEAQGMSEKVQEDSSDDSPTSQVLDKVEVYIDRACDDNYIEILSDEETHEAERGHQHVENGGKLNENLSDNHQNKESLCENISAVASSNLAHAVSTPKQGEKGLVHSGKKIDNKSNADVVCGSGVNSSNIEAGQSNVKDVSNKSQNVKGENEPVASMEVDSSNPNSQETQGSENLVSSSNYIDQEDVISNSVDHGNNKDNVAQENRVTNSGLDIVEIADSCDMVDTTEKVDISEMQMSQESVQFIEEIKVKEDKQDGDDQNYVLLKGVTEGENEEKFGEKEHIKNTGNEIEDSKSPVENKEDKVKEPEENDVETAENVQSVDCQKQEDLIKQSKEVVEDKIGSEVCASSQEKGVPGSSYPKEAGDNNNGEDIENKKESIEELNKAEMDEQEENVPESSSSSKDQQVDNKLQECEVTNSDETAVDDFGNYAKSLIQQAMDKLKEPIVAVTSVENCAEEDLEASSSISKSGEKKKSKEEQDYKEKTLDKVKKLKNGKDITTKKVQSQHMIKEKSNSIHSKDSSKKSLRNPSEAVIDLTEAKSPSDKRCQQSKKITQVQVKHKPTDLKHQHSHPVNRATVLNRRGSANSPIVLSDTSGIEGTNSSKLMVNSKQAYSSSSRSSTSIHRKSGKSLNPASTSQPDVTIKAVSKPLLGTQLPYTSKSKIKNNYADIIKSVTNKVFSGGPETSNAKKQSQTQGGSPAYVNPMLDFSSIKPSPTSSPKVQVLRNIHGGSGTSPLIPCATSTPKSQVCRTIGQSPSSFPKSSSPVLQVMNVSRQLTLDLKTSEDKNTLRKRVGDKSKILSKRSGDDGVVEPSSTQDLSGEDVVGSSGQPPELGSVILLDD